MSESKDTEELVDHEYRGRQLKIYPEVAEFFRTKAEAERVYRVDELKATSAYQALLNEKKIAWLEANPTADVYSFPERREMGEVYRQHVAELEAIRGRHGDAIEAHRADPSRRHNRDNPNAWATLRDTTSHKEVKWIMQNTIQNNAHEAEIMLHYLPGTPEELWERGKHDHDFCTVFDQYYTQAEAAGVFSDADVTSMAGFKEFRALQSYMRRELYSTTASNVGQRVSKIMAIMRDAHKAELEAAKAEWQGLDEAWRSERSRRAAATRAANREAQAEEYAEATMDRLAEEISQRSVITTQSAMTGETIRAEYDENGPVNKEAAPALRIVANPA